MTRTQNAGQLHSADIRHLNIQEDQLHVYIIERLERRCDIAITTFQPQKRRLFNKSADKAQRQGFVVDSYIDEAEGVLEKRADGKMAMTRVTLRPRIAWGATPPDEAALADLHHRAHEACFIANSVTTEVTVQH